MATPRVSHSALVIHAGLALALLAPATVVAQPLPAPMPGRTIQAADGDVIVVGPLTRVAIVRRVQGQGRLVQAADGGGVLLVMESIEPDPGVGTGGKRFRSWKFASSAWPLGPRWEGELTLDEYLPSGSGGPGGPGGMAIHTDRGTVFIGHLSNFPISPKPMAVLQPGSMSAGTAWGTLDEIEQQWTTGGDEALSRGQRMQMRADFGRAPQSDIAVSSGGVGAVVTRSSPAGAVRVGGNIRVPARLNQVAPVYPQQAKDARVQGVVIVEVVVGADGSVSDARTLRSIPLLDEAALECVRQWRYEPTLLNGTPVPVIMTVTVNFTLDQ
jgi:TonB family protein